MKTFINFLTEEKEITVGDYSTKYHYMCPSAVKFLKKHMKMDHDIKDLEKIAKLGDEVFRIEADVERTGESNENQISSAKNLTKQYYDVVEKMGHKKSEAIYMDDHIEAIEKPKLAGSMKEETNPRIPRKAGQPAGSDKHSDLYTDENPKDTIQGLKFATPDDAKSSVSKIKKSGRKHAHKIQAAIAMEQRAKAAGKASSASIYRSYINKMKKKTKEMNK